MRPSDKERRRPGRGSAGVLSWGADDLAQQYTQPLKTATAEQRTYRGQIYSWAGSRPHTCRDGRETRLAMWSTVCADCARPFFFASPAKAAKFAPNRRCQRCKRPGQRVRGGDV